MPDDPETIIRNRISVTRQMVVIAKSFALQHFAAQEPSPASTDDMIAKFLEHVDADPLKPNAKVVRQQSGDWVPSLESKANAISWKLSAIQAVWELVNSSCLIPYIGGLRQYIPGVQYATPLRGDSWKFKASQVSYPTELTLPPSHTAHGEARTQLTNPDLFLHNLNVPNMSDTVKEALQEAVLCFRHELYTACVVMLGKASEEVWIDVGVALNEALPGDRTQKIDELTDPNTSIYRSLRIVTQLYQDNPELEDVRRKSAVRLGLKNLKNLNDALIWSDTIRDSRNVVHPGSSPSTPNTYEKVAALLLGAVPRLRELYRVLSEAQKHKSDGM